ncbi:MAG: bifunctional 5,10-methylene-tetrahydrofolate dehydrogenase/5,10-methylene-tetrahydrofolate cyclohydrolase, partial [Xanthomonadales bacterium]|nr:bifunctional 5,10-methylene-tetrahydrofolate dehydrogenase/5,10-methylene-tetrahydrofolate cyclohydrolase [Xanthomonadales bacterium]NIO13575.1 bifunctional 5,10-methylene-tetrahydrofolate dehydrogenase/5,10-methylene-tetrahydrofolate cyclohydrolase [Xanthomonadales bacterium]
SDNPGAKYYARSQGKACAEVGIDYELRRLDPDAAQGEIIAEIQNINADDSVSGVILLMPVPDGVNARQVQQAMRPDKDVEGVHPANIGRLFYGDFSL